MSTGPYCYEYPHPAVTTDVALFRLSPDGLTLLLIRRANGPFQGDWALPGGFLEIDEDLHQCAARELCEETGVVGVALREVGTFGRPGRDPRERVISVVYYGLAARDGVAPQAASDAAEAAWFPLGRLPALAFDHAEIIRAARQRLVGDLIDPTVAAPVLPERFTLAELQAVYEGLLAGPWEAPSARVWTLALAQIEETGEERPSARGQPARLYRLKRPSA